MQGSKSPNPAFLNFKTRSFPSPPHGGFGFIIIGFSKPILPSRKPQIFLFAKKQNNLKKRVVELFAPLVLPF